MLFTRHDEFSDSVQFTLGKDITKVTLLVGYQIKDWLGMYKSTNRLLDVLYVTCRQIDLDAFNVIAEGIVVSDVTPCVCFWSSSISDAHVPSIIKIIKGTKNLKEIHIQHNKITDKGLIMIAEALVGNKNINKIFFDGNHNSISGQKLIDNIISQNKEYLKLKNEKENLVVNSLKEVVYDNPMLNYSDLVEKFYGKHGGMLTSKLVDFMLGLSDKSKNFMSSIFENSEMRMSTIELLMGVESNGVLDEI